MRLIKALVAISLVASAASAAAGPIKLTFDGLGQADNTLMRDQYAGQGVNFFFNVVLAGDKGSYSSIGNRPSGTPCWAWSTSIRTCRPPPRSG